MIFNDTLIWLTNTRHIKLLPCWSLLATDCANHVVSNSFIHLLYLFCHLYDIFRRNILGYVALVIINAICTNWGNLILPIYNMHMNKYFIKNSRRVCLQKIERNEIYCKYTNEHDCNHISANYLCFKRVSFGQLRLHRSLLITDSCFLKLWIPNFTWSQLRVK
jgi:hypothetical protein